MKTIRYFISVENCECLLVSEMEITKAQFYKQMGDLLKETRDTKDHEFKLDTLKEQTIETDSYIKTIYCFNCCCGYTYLTKIECKKGYCFKKK